MHKQQDVQRALQELQDSLFESRMVAKTLPGELDTEAALRDVQESCLQVKQRMHELLASLTQSYARISRICDALSIVSET